MKKGIYNLIFGLGGQILILAVSILVPRFVLQSYGDEANGLVNAIGQVFTYLALIEAGIGQTALQALYGPVVKELHKETSAILSATQQMFRKLTYVYIAVVVGMAFLYPLFVRVEDTHSINFLGSSYWAIVFIILIQGCANAVSFYFVSTLRQLFIADGCNYIIVNITTLIKILTSIFRIALINMRVNLVILQLVYLGLAVFEVIIYKCVLKKRYSWLNLKEKPNYSALAQRNAFVVHETCNVIFSSTDVLILSMFCSLNAASIYAIYNLVFAAINTLISQVHSGSFYILGQTYSKDPDEYKKIHDTYDTYYISFVFAMIATTYVMILPFVKLYTNGVSKLNYVDPILPILFCSIQLLSCCRITSSNLIKLAGHANQTIKRAIAEAAINLIVSVVMAQIIGIYGVLIGTIVALLYRTNDMVIYANTKILHRSPWVTYKIIGTNMLLFFVVMLVSINMIRMELESFVSFFVISGGLCVLLLIVFLGVNSVANPTSWEYVSTKVKQKVHKWRGGVV